jgi:DNA-directed RNA polymerase specialized sigma24 family protein
MSIELRRTFISALESLPDLYRQLLTLHEVNGLHAEAISHVLGITPAQARIGIRQARLAMRGRLMDRMRPAAG